MLFLDEQNVRYVGITSAFLNSLVLLLLGVKCTMAGTIAIAHPSCAVAIHSNGDNARCYGFGWILVLILILILIVLESIMERCRVGFGRAASTLVF